MRIAFYYEYGRVKEIGTGHYYRSRVLANELVLRGHEIVRPSNKCDVVVIDHMFSQARLIYELKQRGIKTVLIDGAAEDTDLVDASISVCINRAAKYTGLEYLIIPPIGKERYSTGQSNLVFVSMGGFDYNNYAECVINILGDFGIKAIVTRSINHKFNADFFEGADFYMAMGRCKIAITAGGLTMFQCLCFGIPTIALAQYEHQKTNIDLVSSACISSDTNRLKEDISDLLLYADLDDLSIKSQSMIDGKGFLRVCDIVEHI